MDERRTQISWLAIVCPVSLLAQFPAQVLPEISILPNPPTAPETENGDGEGKRGCPVDPEATAHDGMLVVHRATAIVIVRSVNVLPVEH